MVRTPPEQLSCDVRFSSSDTIKTDQFWAFKPHSVVILRRDNNTHSHLHYNWLKTDAISNRLQPNSEPSLSATRGCDTAGSSRLALVMILVTWGFTQGQVKNTKQLITPHSFNVGYFFDALPRAQIPAPQRLAHIDPVNCAAQASVPYGGGKWLLTLPEWVAGRCGARDPRCLPLGNSLVVRATRLQYSYRLGHCFRYNSQKKNKNKNKNKRKIKGIELRN